jgi:tryptophanyl-tRNA synthetase
MQYTKLTILKKGSKNVKDTFRNTTIGYMAYGNYFAMMKPMIELQYNTELFCFIVIYHALTSIHDPRLLAQNTVRCCYGFYCLGLDPDKAHFWVQADIPEVYRISWILSCHTSMGLLNESQL